MRNWLFHAGVVLSVLLATAGPTLALEVGDRLPRLTLRTAAGTTFTLPNAELKAPMIVWFPLAWRTPASLCQKLITVAHNNNASVVIVPIFSDTEAARRIPKFSDSPTDEVAPSATPEAPDSELGSSVVKPDDSAPSTPVLTSKSESAVPAPSPSSSAVATSAETSPLDSQPSANAPSVLTDSETANVDENDSAEPEDSSEQQRAEAINAYRQRLEELSALYPQAHFLGDENNQALISFTEAYATNLMPNPNLFILDARGEVIWQAFYPGLTASTLTRAIVSAQPHRQRHN